MEETTNNRLDQKYHGALHGIEGPRYEKLFYIQKLVELLLQSSSEDRIKEVTRTKRNTYVDDVHVITETRDIHYQCKTYADYKEELFGDFLSQFSKEKSSFFVLITQNKDKWYAQLAKDARKFVYKDFLDNLTTDSQIRNQNKKFNLLLNYLKGIEESNNADHERHLYEFLKHFDICSIDDIYSEVIIREKLLAKGYSVGNTENILNRFYKQADNYNWQGKPVTIEKLKKELKAINIKYIAKEESVTVNNKPASQKFRKEKAVHILQDPNIPFYKKLSYILDLTESPNKHQLKEREQCLKIINKDSTLAWHFFKNLKSPDWFPVIKNNLIKSVVERSDNTAVKYTLLNYLEGCFSEYSDEIIPLLVKIERNTNNEDMLSAFIKTLAKLKPGKKTDFKPIWQILINLVEHQHPWVRKEIPDTLKEFSDFNLQKSLKLLEKLFRFTPTPQDVTRDSPTLALTFQGRDNENRVFEQSARVLSQLMADKRSSCKAFDLAIKLEIHFIKQSRENIEKTGGITLDYSYIWLSDRDALSNIKYEYDRRIRIGLEIEKTLNEFANTDTGLAKQLFSKLLRANYEVFCLAVIRVLTRHTDKYLDLVEELVFNKKLLIVYNIRTYFLQTLIQKYFRLKQDRLPEYIQLIKKISRHNNPETTDYLKQDLFVSIPENLRTQDVEQELERIKLRVKSPAKIRKSFEITSWSGPRPDISLEELKRKTTEQLIQVMKDATSGKRRAKPSDLSGLFGELIMLEPDKLPTLLDKMSGNKIAEDFAGCMMQNYIKANQSDLRAILNIFWKLQEKDKWARSEIARLLNSECRKEKIIDADKSLLMKIKNVLFELSEDEDPRGDDTIWTSDKHPHDALTRGINSVRGMATEALVVLAHYYQHDKGITERLEKLSNDSTNAVKATLIYNLRFLTAKNYLLCKNIVNKFRNKRDHEIDFSLIHYFASLDSKKFQANIDFIKLLFANPHKEIQKNLGELIGRNYIKGFNLQKLIDDIIKQKTGKAETRQSLAFIFETNLGRQIELKKHLRILGYYKKLLDPQHEPDFGVRERAAFAFSMDDLKTQFFDILYKNGVYEPILKDSYNLASQSHLIDYLSRCISDTVSVNKCIEILHEQVLKADGIWSDQLIVQKISVIVRHLLQNKPSNKKTTIHINEIFDKGLERGWEEFYNLYYEFYR